MQKAHGGRKEGCGMVRLTQSLAHWLFENHREKLPLIMLGHLELFTDEMKQEYLAWCKTDEGAKYLKGGSEYKKELDPYERVVKDGNA